MTNHSALLAHKITWQSSKQSYLTAVLLADRNLVNDCLRAYAYFRWADDLVDDVLSTREERLAFISRQRTLIAALYKGERPTDLCREETMLADLVSHDRAPHSGLCSFIEKFMSVIAFDAVRRGDLVSQIELDIYMERLGCAVMDGLLYFIGNGHPYPKAAERNRAVIGAHMTHMLRDLQEDLPQGFINVPEEILRTGRVHLDNTQSPAFCEWVRKQVNKARKEIEAGKRYIDRLDVLRCKLAGIWYCARFERVLSTIERDGYVLRSEYPDRKNLAAWLEMVRLGVEVTFSHVFARFPFPAAVDRKELFHPG